MANGKLTCALLCFALSACVAPTSPDAGCRAYGEQRVYMPPLGSDAVSEWVATTDSAMTGACRP
jgi:hypothetical protein